MAFAIGQRWISNTETQLGLGVITKLNGREVYINFPAADEERIYAKDNAPLSRIIFKEGEVISTTTLKKLTVFEVIETYDLLSYLCVNEQGKQIKISEFDLDPFINLNAPEQRLFGGLLDKQSSFKLRVESLNHLARLQQSKASGLIGARTSHLPHQLYIADEVARRYAPRVLLADEVGLGKTIEAGLIIHHQLITGRAHRVLVITPKSLIHQWFVEMKRRFNLHFALFDQRLDAMDEPESNLFETEQLIICSLEYFMDNKEATSQACQMNWDLLVVDEAHHLRWEEDFVSPEYACINALSAKSKGLLLLTATPEQVGIQSHFARLRLLDPERFYDFEAFLKEEAQYKIINELIQELNLSEHTSHHLKQALKPYFGDELPESHDEIISDLLDRYGTGRVLFRNTRAAIQGFPKRELHPEPLKKPAAYSNQLYPELNLHPKQWLQEDPRVSWLVSKLKDLYPQKVLLICAHKNTALALSEHLQQIIGLRTALFHEGLTIIERDRQAAYFAESGNGAQILLCSEIGSEGRNFQFAHHLVLFDLPLNPDLLEQRIGRLDRIGQHNCIEIHLPYLLDTAQETLYRWYHEGIDLFESSCSVASPIFEAVQTQLLALLDQRDEAKLDELIKNTKNYTKQLNQALSEGRDRLLELNSCNITQAKALIKAIEEEENTQELELFMAKIFNEYGIEHEHHSDQCEILRPSAEMQVHHFPGLSEDEMTITYSRKKALQREDLEFLSWEHPMVRESMEMLLDSELGQAAVASMSVKNIPAGNLFLEAFYTVNCSAPSSLQLSRFLPLKPIRFFMDISGKNLTKIIDHQQLNKLCQDIKRHLGTAIINKVRKEIEALLKQTTLLAELEMQAVIEASTTQMHQVLAEEINRMLKLQKVNLNIRGEEIQYLKDQSLESETFIQSSALKLQALRLVINQ